VSDEGPRIPLPDEITISRDEAGILLAAPDLGEAAVDAQQRPTMRRAIRIVTAKLWPELGDLFDDSDG
jgi:hypothetical protein